MKSNNTPRSVRLSRRIAKLEDKLCALESKPYGRGNPYHYCGACGRSMVEASYKGHYTGCRYVGIQNEIKYYRSIMVVPKLSLTTDGTDELDAPDE